MSAPRMIPTLPLAMENITMDNHRNPSPGRPLIRPKEDQQTKPRLLTPLTVEMVRTQYWDATKKIGKPVKFYSMQTYDGKDIDYNPITTVNENGNPHGLEIFILDGTLHHVNKKTGEREIIPNWLSTSTGGPYKEEDRGKGLPDRYSLGGYYVYNNGTTEKSKLQICSGPLNVLSTDCLDEVNVWI